MHGFAGSWRVGPGLLVVLALLGGAALYSTGRFAETLAALFVVGLLVGLLGGGLGRALAAGIVLPVLSLVAYIAIAAFLLLLKVLVFLAALALAFAVLWALIYFLRGRL